MKKERKKEIDIIFTSLENWKTFMITGRYDISSDDVLCYIYEVRGAGYLYITYVYQYQYIHSFGYVICMLLVRSNQQLVGFRPSAKVIHIAFIGSLFALLSAPCSY